jgi:RimJ/RimL family protein N-acetyltransferase
VKPRRDPVIITARLTLRLPRESDVDALMGGIGDPAVSRMLVRVPFPYYESDAEAFIALARRRAQAGRSLNLAIIHDGRLIGGIGINTMPVYCEIGYWLGRRWWGQGFATEAGEAVVAFGFDVLGLRLLRSGVFADNHASLGVQRKLGFSVIGRSLRPSLARQAVVAHIDTVLTRRRYQAFAR